MTITEQIYVNLVAFKLEGGETDMQKVGNYCVPQAIELTDIYRQKIGEHKGRLAAAQAKAEELNKK